MDLSRVFRKNLGIICLFFLTTSAIGAVRPDTINGKSLEYEYAFEEAVKQYNFGNYSQALFLFRKCLEVNGNSVASNFQMANIYLLAGESQKALTFAREAYQLDNSNKWVSLLLIKCYQLVDRNDSALRVMELLLKSDKDNLDLKYEYGSLLSSVGRFNEALACFNEIDAKTGINEGTALARHQIYVQKKDFQSAISELKSLIRIFPDEIRYRGMLAELYSSMHLVEKAKEVYSSIFQTDSTNILALVSVADFYREIKEYGKATLMLNRILDANDVQLDSKMGLIIAYIRNDSDLVKNGSLVRNSIGKLARLYPGEIKIDKLLVDFFIRTNDYDSAIVAIEKFIGTEENQDIWEQYFLLLNSRRKFTSVVDRFTDAKKFAGNVVGIYIIAGIANIQLKRYTEAVEVLNLGFQVKELKISELTEILEYKAEALFKLRQFKESDSCFEEVLKREPLNYLVLNNYSFYLSLRDTMLKKAAGMSRKTIQKYPQNAVYLDTYGYILIRMHKYRQAYKWMLKAVQYNSMGDPDIYEHMGDVLFYRNELEKAKSFWKEAKEKGKVNLSIDEKIKSLKK